VALWKWCPARPGDGDSSQTKGEVLQWYLYNGICSLPCFLGQTDGHHTVSPHWEMKTMLFNASHRYQGEIPSPIAELVDLLPSHFLEPYLQLGSPPPNHFSPSLSPTALMSKRLRRGICLYCFSIPLQFVLPNRRTTMEKCQDIFGPYKVLDNSISQCYHRANSRK